MIQDGDDCDRHASCGGNMDEWRTRGSNNWRMEWYGPGPAQFDGTYEIDGLAVGHSYTVYAGALNGAVDPSQFDTAVVSLLTEYG